VNYRHQQIAVLGAGRSGQAAARLAVREGACPVVYDTGEPGKLRAIAATLDSEGIAHCFGAAALEVPVTADLAVISPGIDAAWDLPRRFVEAGVRVIGETEFAFTLGKVPVVGITGTNGKTTTTELVARILSWNGQRTVACGNYGLPYSEVVLSGEDYDVLTMEISSFQCETIETFHCPITVWLNFAPDHLDRYPSVAAYRTAKMRIFETQTAHDVAIVDARDPMPALAARKVTFSAFDAAADYTFDGVNIHFKGAPIADFRATRLRGTHNAENLMAALAVGRERGLAYDAMMAAAADYFPPRHRCEFIATVDGCDYINDSKATNLHALESSLVAMGKDVILIAGGKQKGLPFAELRATVARHARYVVLIGEIREQVRGQWADAAPCELADSVDEAVALARKAARPGQTVLFSPGTSSFDMFSGYEERGDTFRNAVTKLN
jgi:UDP-N-acetylmuramoylalanine--D-glutamate ligase